MLDFTEDTIPAVTSTRTTRENPFTGMFPLPEGKAVSSVIPFGSKKVKEKNKDGVEVEKETHPDGIAAEVLKRDAQAAGRAAGVTTRVKIEWDGKSKTAKMILWNVPAIKRERKSTETQTAAAE
jgi:hypothetical protein